MAILRSLTPTLITKIDMKSARAIEGIDVFCANDLEDELDTLRLAPFTDFKDFYKSL